MAAKKDQTIVIETLKRQEATFTIVGLTGLYCHRMSAKAKRQLMIGGRKKTTSEKQSIKHDPPSEFVDSMYVERNAAEHSNVLFPSIAVKAAMATAALTVDGITKADVHRLVRVVEEFIPIYGVPRLRMDIARSADAARTPDVRTRAFFREWATQVTISWIEPNLSRTTVARLIQNAGMVCGIGDFRQEKGKGNYGTFTLADEVPESLLDRDLQWEHIQTPVPDNQETAQLLIEFEEELEVRA